MENENTNTGNQDVFPVKHTHNRRLGGLVIIAVGVLLLLTRIPQTAPYFPLWLFSWPMLLVYFGIYIGAVHSFRNGERGWIILVLIGLGFLLYRQQIIQPPLRNYLLPAALILIGIIFIFRKRWNWHHDNYRWKRNFADRTQRFSMRAQARAQRWTNLSQNLSQKEVINDDEIRLNSVFSSVDKFVLSKNFKGGVVTCTCGSCELNLSQADIQETAILNIELTLGSVEITVPANWIVKNEINAFLGQVEDKRLVSPTSADKILMLKGSASLGSVEIRN